MYLNITILVLLILLYGMFTGKIEKMALSGPIIFLICGIVAGPLILNILDTNIKTETIRVLAEMALALVLFTDAAKSNIKVLEHNITIPVRLLVIGLPLTIIFGLVAGLMIFKEFLWVELAILATILAPTDAALGKAVVSNPVVPSKIREGLNVESGLNDGICVPVLFLLIALLTAQAAADVSIQYGLVLFAKEIGIGLITGLGITCIALSLIGLGDGRNWITGSWKSLIIITLAFSCFFLAQVTGGSGFIACFSGGILFGFMHKKQKIDLLNAAEGTGDILSLVTWFIFGSVAIAAVLSDFSWTVLLYAILILTLVRMIPVFISLITIILSILAHGISANPFVKDLKISK